jgi:hypothetical protein
VVMWWNIRGAAKSLAEIMRMKSERNVAISNLLETFCWRNDLGSSTVAWKPGAECMRKHNSPYPKRGMAAMALRSIAHTVLTVHPDSMWSVLELDGGLKLYVGSCYVAADKDERERAFAGLTAELARLPSDAVVVLGGDFNARIAANGDCWIPKASTLLTGRRGMV